jgi:hypothetical protein
MDPFVAFILITTGLCAAILLFDDSDDGGGGFGAREALDR